MKPGTELDEEFLLELLGAIVNTDIGKTSSDKMFPWEDLV